MTPLLATKTACIFRLGLSHGSPSTKHNSMLTFRFVCCVHQSDRRILVCISHQADRCTRAPISHQSNRSIGACLHQSERQETVPHVNDVMELGCRKALQWNQLQHWRTLRRQVSSTGKHRVKFGSRSEFCSYTYSRTHSLIPTTYIATEILLHLYDPFRVLLKFALF